MIFVCLDAFSLQLLLVDLWMAGDDLASTCVEGVSTSDPVLPLDCGFFLVDLRMAGVDSSSNVVEGASSRDPGLLMSHACLCDISCLALRFSMCEGPTGCRPWVIFILHAVLDGAFVVQSLF